MVTRGLIVRLEAKSGEEEERLVRELDRRVSGGLEIRLLWNARDNSTAVELRHRAVGVGPLRFDVPPALALEAFHHPFAHLAAAPDDLLPE
jgi:hypothetical protein